MLEILCQKPVLDVLVYCLGGPNGCCALRQSCKTMAKLISYPTQYRNPQHMLETVCWLDNPEACRIAIRMGAHDLDSLASYKQSNMMYKLIEEFKAYASYGEVLKMAVSFGIDGICKEMIEGWSDIHELIPKKVVLSHMERLMDLGSNCRVFVELCEWKGFGLDEFEWLAKRSVRNNYVLGLRVVFEKMLKYDSHAYMVRRAGLMATLDAKAIRYGDGAMSEMIWFQYEMMKQRI